MISQERDSAQIDKNVSPESINDSSILLSRTRSGAAILWANPALVEENHILKGGPRAELGPRAVMDRGRDLFSHIPDPQPTKRKPICVDLTLEPIRQLED